MRGDTDGAVALIVTLNGCEKNFRLAWSKLLTALSDLIDCWNRGTKRRGGRDDDDHQDDPDG